MKRVIQHDPFQMGNFLVLGEISSVRPLPRRCSKSTGDDAPAHGARQGQHVFAHGGGEYHPSTIHHHFHHHLHKQGRINNQHGGGHHLPTTLSIQAQTSESGDFPSTEDLPPFPHKLDWEISPQCPLCIERFSQGQHVCTSEKEGSTPSHTCTPI